MTYKEFEKLTITDVYSRIFAETKSDSDTITDAHFFLKNCLPEYPKKPHKPRLKNNTTDSSAIREHSKLMIQYADDLDNYEPLKKEWQLFDAQVHNLMTEILKDISGFYIDVPEKSQSKVWSMAWSRGHSSGYNDVFNYLTELVDLFIE